MPWNVIAFAVPVRPYYMVTLLKGGKAVVYRAIPARKYDINAYIEIVKAMGYGVEIVYRGEA